MSPNIFRSLAVLASVIVYVSATSILSVKLTGPEHVNSIRDLKVQATLTNVGDQTVRVLNDPRGPLSTMATDRFAIANEAGESPSFVGVNVRYVPETAAAIDAYSILETGKSITVEHDLSLAYDFTSSGPGYYTIDVQNVFYIVNTSNGGVLPISADTVAFYTHIPDGSELSIETFTDLDSDSDEPLNTLASFKGCSYSQKTAINSAVYAAQAYATKAYSMVRSSRGTSAHYRKWFGAYNSRRFNTVVSHFQRIRGNRFSTFTYDCTCNTKDSYAFVYANKFGTIHLCPLFWKSPLVGIYSKAGTIIHESSHFTKNGGTKDHIYGPGPCQALARRDPGRAIMNADNHSFFIESA